MIDLKSELEQVRKEKEQVVAHYNALLGAEKMLEKLIMQSEIIEGEQNERNNADKEP